MENAKEKNPEKTTKKESFVTRLLGGFFLFTGSMAIVVVIATFFQKSIWMLISGKDFFSLGANFFSLKAPAQNINLTHLIHFIPFTWGVAALLIDSFKEKRIVVLYAFLIVSFLQFALGIEARMLFQNYLDLSLFFYGLLACLVVAVSIFASNFKSYTPKDIIKYFIVFVLATSSLGISAGRYWEIFAPSVSLLVLLPVVLLILAFTIKKQEGL